MTALHHMPDYRAALAEMHRVLRPGGRAAFSEPGSLHSQSPESVRAIEEFGALEKDVVLEQVHALAREVGFERMVLKPYLYPEHVDLDFRDYEGFRRGYYPPGTRVDPWTVTEIFHKSHVLFCLEKGGTPEPTSVNAPPGLLRAALRVAVEPIEGAPGALRLAASCENTGGSTWIAAVQPTGAHVTFGVRIVRDDGRLVDDLRGRTALPRDVRPGETVEVLASLTLEGLPPGRYRLVFDMVAERVAWFSDLGSPTVEHPVEVR
jgi:SAM-dependent methyltransferase